MSLLGLYSKRTARLSHLTIKNSYLLPKAPFSFISRKPPTLAFLPGSFQNVNLLNSSRFLSTDNNKGKSSEENLSSSFISSSITPATPTTDVSPLITSTLSIDSKNNNNNNNNNDKSKPASTSWRWKIKYDLGIGELKEDWKKIFKKEHLSNDVFAGTTVAFVAVPLSLAIAVASGLPPGVGMITAIVGGTAASLFGGTPLSVTGPAAAMSILVAGVVGKFGVTGLIFVTLVCGALQVLTGVFKLGSLIKLIPQSVIAGFSTGVGGLILSSQLPKVLGLPAPHSSDSSHGGVLGILEHVVNHFHEFQWAPLSVALTTLGVALILPKINPKLPALVIGVGCASALSYCLPVPMAVVGHLPESLPWPSFPVLPDSGFVGLLEASIMVFSLASLESLLSSSVADKFNKDKTIRKHDPNQELIGQGISNMSVSLFGGMPVTSVIARTALNISAGAKTRRSALIHCVLLLSAISVLNPVVSAIPMAALSGVLLSVATRLLNPNEFLHIWKCRPSETIPYLITVAAILAKDLVFGVEVGVLSSVIMTVIGQKGKIKGVTFTETKDEDGHVLFKLSGHLTSFAAVSFRAFQNRVIQEAEPSALIAFDFSDLKGMDISGGEMLLDLCKQLHDHGFASRKKLKFINLSPRQQTLLLNIAHEDSELLHHFKKNKPQPEAPPPPSDSPSL